MLGKGRLKLKERVAALMTKGAARLSLERDDGPITRSKTRRRETLDEVRFLIARLRNDLLNSALARLLVVCICETKGCVKDS